MMALPELSSVRVPVHVLVGERDEYAPVDVLEGALQPVPDVRLEIVPDADHFFSTLMPETLSTRIAQATERG